MIDAEDEFVALAHRHLPPEVAGRWLGLRRPTVALVPADDAAEPVGRLGGEPALPPDAEWPTWAAHGPLSFVASVDCARLPADGLDIALPADGTLLFFYYDAEEDDDLVTPDDPLTWAGARVLYVPAGTPVALRPAPVNVEPYNELPLVAQTRVTAAEAWHPVVHAAFAPPGAPILRRYDHPVSAEAFADAVGELRCRQDIGHRIGGYANPVQSPVEWGATPARCTG